LFFVIPRKARNLSFSGAKPEMIYQLNWKTLPGLRGLSCSGFQAAETASPDNERGVAVAFASAAERDAMLAELETYFGPQRFSNNAAAFEAVKAYALEACAKKAGPRVSEL
jgi:hypothetical protein